MIPFPALQAETDLWHRVPAVAPLVLIGTLEEDGQANLAPKHLAMPMGAANLFGFICRPEHATYRNVVARDVFTVCYPTPQMLLATSLAAAPRASDGTKPTLELLRLSPAQLVPGVLVSGCPVQLECRLQRIVEGFGHQCLVVGQVVLAHVADDLAGKPGDADTPPDLDPLAAHPALAYVHPGRVASLTQTRPFPYHPGFHD